MRSACSPPEVTGPLCKRYRVTKNGFSCLYAHGFTGFSLPMGSLSPFPRGTCALSDQKFRSLLRGWSPGFHRPGGERCTPSCFYSTSNPIDLRRGFHPLRQTIHRFFKDIGGLKYNVNGQLFRVRSPLLADSPLMCPFPPLPRWFTSRRSSPLP